MIINSGWSKSESPFHQGELAIQTRLGIKERMDKQGRRVIREYLTEQHRQFFAKLPYLIVGTVDKFGYPWASILVGETGFISTPTERHLRVNVKLLFDEPLSTNLAEGIDVGFLGIELHTRRRNRMNGIVSKIDANGFEVQVKQSFGNCPQYIQPRKLQKVTSDNSKPQQIGKISTLGSLESKMIANADTFFIATAYQDKSAQAARGVDVSHRGGKTGFVKIQDQYNLTIPDFSGNNHFNTIGNLELNPLAGLLFIDFSRGDLLYLTGSTEIIWEGEEIAYYEGAQRLIKFHLLKGYFVKGTTIKFNPN